MSRGDRKKIPFDSVNKNAEKNGGWEKFLEFSDPADSILLQDYFVFFAVRTMYDSLISLSACQSPFLIAIDFASSHRKSFVCSKYFREDFHQAKVSLHFYPVQLFRQYQARLNTRDRNSLLMLCFYKCKVHFEEHHLRRKLIPTEKYFLWLKLYLI